MNLNWLLNHQVKTVSIAALFLATSSLISKFLGVIRNWLLAKNFGAGPDLDVYFAAFKIPDFVYQILILGGISVAFLPLFSEYSAKNKKEAWDFVANCLNIFMVLLILLCLVLFISAPLLVKLIAPGFDYQQAQKTIVLTRVMFLSPILFGLSSIFSGILQYFNRFLIYSLCPILYNLGIILGILFLAPRFGILGVALGVILGAFLHLAIQAPAIFSSGFRYKRIFNLGDARIKKVFMLMIPRTFGISAQQINLFVITAIASTLGVGAISIFNFANDIQYFPIGVVGISFAVAAFPALSKSWAQNQKEKFIENFSLVFRQILYLIIPISILIFVLRNQIIEVILRHGEFSAMAAQLTSASLALFCFSIFASTLIPLIFRAFFSFKDTKTPTIIAIASVVLNVVLSFLLTKALVSPDNSWWGIQFNGFLRNVFTLDNVENISVLGLPLAVSVSSIFQLFLLTFFLKKKLIGFNIKEILISLTKIFIAVAVMLIVLYNIPAPKGAIWQLGIMGFIGFLVYTSTTLILDSPEVKSVKTFLSKKKSLLNK